MVFSNKPFPRKSLSQNYLTDENICRKIVNTFDIKKDDIVIEIGSGRGAITKYIIQKTKNFAAVELDKENCDILRKSFPDIRLFNADFLKTDFHEFTELFQLRKPNGLRPELRIIGNIPYNITSEILFKLFDNRAYIKDTMLMIQEEVAARLTAVPCNKVYGITSVFTQVFTTPKLLFKVSKNCFFPKPGVDSRIIYFKFGNKAEFEILDLNFFKKIVKQSFGTRRKTLKKDILITGC